VLDPFCGSGTTLVEAVGLGRDAAGSDISAFNALLSREKTLMHDAVEVAAGLGTTLARAEALAAEEPGEVPAYLTEWYGEKASGSCWPTAGRSSRTAPGAASRHLC